MKALTFPPKLAEMAEMAAGKAETEVMAPPFPHHLWPRQAKPAWGALVASVGQGAAGWEESSALVAAEVAASAPMETIRPPGMV